MRDCFSRGRIRLSLAVKVQQLLSEKNIQGVCQNDSFCKHPERVENILQEYHTVGRCVAINSV